MRGDACDGARSTMSRNRKVAKVAPSYGPEKENERRMRGEAESDDQTSEYKRAEVSVWWRGVWLLGLRL